MLNRHGTRRPRRREEMNGYGKASRVTDGSNLWMATNTIILGGGTIALPSIDTAVDAAFAAFYQTVASGGTPDIAQFDAAVEPFLLQSTGAGEHDAYFNCFTPLWLNNLNSGKVQSAIAVWPWALRPVLRAEGKSGKQLHKGTPYYFWGMTVLSQENLEEGYLLMHRALEEDVRTHGNAAPDTPGWALATLNYQKQEQAFLPWVQKQATHVEGRLAKYRSAHNRALTLAELRTRLLAKPAYRDAVQQFCFSMARALRLTHLPQELWTGSFPAQIAFDVLFDLCLVVDAVLHEKNPGQWQFIDHATFLSKACKLGLTNSDLGGLNGLFKTAFPQTLRTAIAGALKLQNGAPVTGLAAALAVTYGCRNRGAHNVASVPMSSKEFSEVVQHISDVLFLALEELY